MTINAGTKPVSITYYEYDPAFPTEFTLSLAGTAEVNGDHTAGIAFNAPGVSWTMVDALGAEIPVPSSFLFTSAGETYTLRARGSLPPGVNTWTYAPLSYGVSASYAPAWAQLIGEIIPTVTRSAGECPLTEPITTYAPPTDTTIATVGMDVLNWPFSGAVCGENAACFTGTIPQTWIEARHPGIGMISGTIVVPDAQGDTAFLQRDFDISSSVGTTFAVQQMAPVVTTHYRIWKECGSRTIHYEWYAVREAGSGTITWGVADATSSTSYTEIGIITSRIKLMLTHDKNAGQAFAAGAWYMGGDYNLSISFVAHS